MDKVFKIAVILSAYDKLSSIVNGAVDKSTSKLDKFNHRVKGFAERTEKGMIVGEGGMLFFEKAVEAAERSEIAERRMKKIFSNMMGAQGERVAEESFAFAKSYQNSIGVQHDVIESVQAKIATFSAIIGENGEKINAFNRSTKLTFDMQAAGFGEALTNAVQLGKAMQNPALGAGALSRAGAINKEDMPLIKQTQATLGLAAAQEMVLKAVEKQVGGVAAITATASSKMAVSWRSVTESIGKHLLPTVDQLASYLGNNLLPRFEAFTESNPVLIKVLAAVSIGLVAVGSAARILGFILETNPIILIIAGIAAAAYLIYDNWEPISEWFSNLWESVTAIFSKTWDWIKNMFLDYTAAGLIIKHWDVISHFFGQLWRVVKIIFLTTWDWIKNMFLNYTPAGLIFKNWDVVSSWFEKLWNVVKYIFKITWEGIKTFLLDYTPQGLIYKHWDEIVTYFTNIWEKVAKVFSNAWKGIKSGLTSFFGGGGDLDKALDRYEKSMGSKAALSINSNGGMSVGLRPSSIANGGTIHYSPNVILNGAATAADAQNFIAMTKVDAVKIMQQANQQKARVAF